MLIAVNVDRTSATQAFKTSLLAQTLDATPPLGKIPWITKIAEIFEPFHYRIER